MSKKWNKSITYIVLISFLALLTPKSVWHDCSHTQKSKSRHSGNTQFNKGIEKCYACDLQIPLLTNPSDGLTLGLHKPAVSSQLPLTGCPCFSSPGSTFLRGPPCV